MSTVLPEYAGWANQPTWQMHLWLSDTKDAYRTVCQIVRDAGDIKTAALAVRAWVEEGKPRRDSAGEMYAELLNWALAQVDWEAIARAFALDEGRDDRPSGN